MSGIHDWFKKLFSPGQNNVFEEVQIEDEVLRGSHEGPMRVRLQIEDEGPMRVP